MRLYSPFQTFLLLVQHVSQEVREFVNRQCLSQQRLLKSIKSWNPGLPKPGEGKEVGMIYFNNGKVRHDSIYLQSQYLRGRSRSQLKVNFAYVASSRPASSIWEPVLRKGEQILLLLASASPIALYFAKFSTSSTLLPGHGIFQASPGTLAFGV